MMKLERRTKQGRTWTVAVFTGKTAEQDAAALAVASDGRAEQDPRGQWLVRPALAPRFDI